MNDWEDVVWLIVVGRTEPPAWRVERQARAVFGVEVVGVEPDEKGRVMYPLVPRGIRMKDGSGVGVMNAQHPDPHAEAVRWVICEAEVIQVIGRGRGVTRGAANPLGVDVITNLVLPDVEVNEIATWESMQPSLAEVMAARGAVLLSYADMATKQTACEWAMEWIVCLG
jgi:putative DNA primase/helicase